MVKAHAKARSIIVKVLGDYYYKELLDHDDVIAKQITFLPEGTIKTQEDVEKFASENISKPMPLDRP